MDPVIAVITPTKNRLPLLCETMDSVQRQSFETWEHVIVDDGSDDGTAEEVARRAAADPRLRYIQRTGDKSGANVCRHLGISESRADLIVFLDSDDLLAPDSLARRVAIMGRNEDLDFVTFQKGVVFQNTHLRRQLDAGLELIGDDLLRFLFHECPWPITGPVWRKASLLRLGLFDESLLSWQDVDLHIRAITAGCRYLRFPEVDHYIRWHFEPTKVSIEQFRSPRHLSAANGILEKFERVVSDGPGMSWVRQRALCSAYFLVAEQWLRTGSLSAALRAWRRIRQRALGSRVLHLTGAALLVIQALGALGRGVGGRLAHKWKGWMRLRTNPDYHPIQEDPPVFVPATFMPLS
ncbi:MAG: glycosyltransferase family 2 protein, partial [Methyloceanibacter sp.]